MEPINDEIIKKIFICNGKLNSNYKRKLSKEYSEYLLNRYDDSHDEIESIIRIYLNIEEHPKCPICGNPVKFYRSVIKPFGTTCSQRCASIYATKFVNTEKRYEKIKKSIKEKYGVDNVFQNEDVKEKIKNIKYERYGDPNFSNREKSKETNIEHWGGPSYFSDKQKKENSIKKKIKTVKEKYGVDNVFQNEDVKEKCKMSLLKHYNVDNASKIEYLKEIRKQKEYETKKINNSFNTSNEEDESYLLLKEKYPDAIRQYKSDKYPWCCDFYVPCLDLYIECNYHWTHGKHLFDNNNIDDVNKLNTWKNKQTKYYDNAIYVWSKLDVNKYNKAKENKLNYIIFYNFNDFKIWVNKKWKSNK